MIDLKGASLSEKPPFKTPGVDFLFKLRHNTSPLKLALDLDLKVWIDRQSGKVSSSLEVAPVEADNLDRSLEKMALWCHRAGYALSGVERVPGDIPTYHTRPFDLETQPSWVKAEFERLAPRFIACRTGPESVSDIREEMIAEQNPLIFISGAYDQLSQLQYPDE